MSDRIRTSGQVLQANWIHPSSVEKWLRSMVIGTSLNVCCGTSHVGDIRVDISPDTTRTEAGDLFNLRFPSQSFDTVICDPPFAFYNRFAWVNELGKIARRRLLLSPDRTVVRLPRKDWSTRIFAFQGTHDTMYLRLYYCYDRKNHHLEPANHNGKADADAGAEQA